MHLAYTFRLLPTRRQHVALEQILESQRQLYNAALEERIDAYRKSGISRTLFDQSKALTEWRRDDPSARAIPVSLQRGTLARLDNAYKAFYRRLGKGARPGFPRFRGRGWFDSFAFREFSGITLKRSALRFKGMPGALRVHFHRELPAGAKIKNCTFVHQYEGWLICFAIEIVAASRRAPERVVGIDLGIATFATFSNGEVVPSLRAARTASRQLRVAQRAVARKLRGSRSRRKAGDRVRRIHRQIKRKRLTFLHQVTARIVRDYDAVAIEKLNCLGLASSAVARDANDAAWSKFISLLQYKAERAGVQLLEVDPRNTSQNCSGCGRIVSKRLEQRIHHCLDCGLLMDRDLNAARNILQRAGVGPRLRNDGQLDIVQTEDSR